MSDLLDLLAELEPAAPRVTHVLLPCMAYACGRNMLEHGGAFQVGIRDWSAIDCPECRACGEESLRVEMRRQQSDQEAVA